MNKNSEQIEQQVARCAAILCASEIPLSLAKLAEVCECERTVLEGLLAQIDSKLSVLGMEMVEVASGLRVQTKIEHADAVGKLFTEASPRFTRATLETLALIAYRQPITRGEIEHIRSVTVSGSIIRGLVERGWIRITGHRDVPGKPALYATTSRFLDYFNLKNLAQLPALPDIKSVEDIDKAVAQLVVDDPTTEQAKRAQA